MAMDPIPGCCNAKLKKGKLYHTCAKAQGHPGQHQCFENRCIVRWVGKEIQNGLRTPCPTCGHLR